MVQLNKFDLPAFFDRDYYESRYLMHMDKVNSSMAKMWEAFYFDNALAFAFCEIFEKEKYKLGWKKAMSMAEDRKKELEKEYKS